MAQAVTDAGEPIFYTGITKLESGEVATSVDVLLALAEALDVAPADLLEPPLPPGQLQAAPSVENVMVTVMPEVERLVRHVVLGLQIEATADVTHNTPGDE